MVSINNVSSNIISSSRYLWIFYVYLEAKKSQMRAEHTIHPINITIAKERPLNNPLCYTPSQEVIAAQSEVIRYLTKLSEQDKEVAEELQRGKMMGVMVVQDRSGNVGFLAGFSGCIAGRVEVAGFVPPIFGRAVLSDDFLRMERAISDMSQEIKCKEQSEEYQSIQKCHSDLLQRISLERENLSKEYKAAKTKRNAERKAATRSASDLALESQRQKGEMRRREHNFKLEINVSQQQIDRFRDEIETQRKRRSVLSYELQREMFASYQVVNGRLERRSLLSIFDELNGHLPPSGAGECAAPKMLHYALTHDLTPLSMGEFWYGNPPRGEVRHHGAFYGACKSRCEPILTYMLDGVNVEPLTPPNRAELRDSLKIIFEDEHLVLFDKPSGMLSVPGRSASESVSSIARELYPDATDSMIVHRLDQDTSGLLLVAKSIEAHKGLSRQFAERTLRKRYIAIVDGIISHDKGTIDLPLRPNIEDRPRQIIDYKHGKSALTTYEVLERNGQTTRLSLSPHTGRTHQLRLHCAHKDGLNAPILGDRLYGCTAERLLLHAESITFRHPISGEEMSFSSAPQF